MRMRKAVEVLWKISSAAVHFATGKTVPKHVSKPLHAVVNARTAAPRDHKFLAHGSLHMAVKK
jgi:hypothetical protein